MHHLLFEFITGGGLSGQDLPESLAHEGDLMLQALLNDLVQAGQTNISLTRDVRLTPLSNNITQHIIDGEIRDRLSKIIKEDDVVWLIAPETDDVLASFAEFFINHGCKYIGSSPDAIRLTSSKMKTFKQLQESGIETIETYYLNHSIPASNNGWIIKPDDGAGAEGCYFFCDKNVLNEFIYTIKQDDYLIQPFVSGKHMSMSLLVYQQELRLLGCNRQYIKLDDEKLELIAVGVNECLDCFEALLTIAKQIVSAVPGLAGYVGVDLIMNEDKITVVEINPRLTTAYAGLSDSLGVNVADILLKTLESGTMPEINVSTVKPVRIDV